MRDHDFFIHRLRTPIGAALLVTDATGALRALDFEDHAARMHRLLQLHYGSCALAPRPAPDKLQAKLRAYFDGDATALGSIAWSTGGTEFQRSVWRMLTTIAPGATTTYGALACALGNPSAARAVGLANGANPVGIVVPCHRVIGANGALTGYGGGLHRKRWLLEHEGVRLCSQARARA